MKLKQTTLLIATMLFPTTTMLFSVQDPVLAQRTGTSSMLTGMAVPSGGAPWKSADKHLTGVLTDLAKIKVVRRSVTGSVETIRWVGAHYEEDRVGFTKAAVRRALTDAGYTVKAVEDDNTSDVNIFTHFDPYEENPPFQPSPYKPASYFVADNEAKQQSLIGVWLESNSELVLSMAPIASPAKVAPKQFPPVPTDAILVQDPTNAMKGVAAPKTPTFTPLTKKPHTVRGQVKDYAGKPVVGAEIVAECSAAGGFRTLHKGRSNAQGIYEILLPTGIAHVSGASVTCSYNRQQYELPLHPALGKSTQFDARTGHVENYVLQTAGGGGGTIRLSDDFQEGTVEITLTPIGPMLDSSPGRTFVYRYNTAEGFGESYLDGVPLGRYKMTARLTEERGTFPLQIRKTTGVLSQRALGDSIEVNFEPGSPPISQMHPATGNRRVQWFQVTLEL